MGHMDKFDAKVYACSLPGLRNVVWTFDLGTTSQPGLSIIERDNVVYASVSNCGNDCSNGTIVALAYQGSKKWSVETNLPPRHIVFDSAGVLYFVTVDDSISLYPLASSVYAVDGNTG